MRRVLAVLALVAGCSGVKSAPPPVASPTPEQTTCGQPVYGIYGDVVWQVTKNGSVPVMGRQGVAGDLEVGEGRALNRAHMVVKFSGAVETGETTRDERIATYIFGEEPLDFTLVSVDIPALPPPGDGANAHITGDLRVGGVTTRLNIPVMVAGHPDGGYHVMSELIDLDMRQQLKLGERIDTMMSLVTASVLDNLEVRFDLELKEECP